MFGKDSKKLETILGEDTEVKGELNVKGTVRIDGFLDGDVRADCVIVGESGKVKGDVKSRRTVVGGTVEGNIDADDIVELKHKSCVVGEIRTGKLAVSEGAVFEGSSRMKTKEEAVGAPEGSVIRINPTSVSS